MNSIQESRLSTARGIKELFGDNTEIWEENKLISDSVGQLDDFIIDIDKTFKLQLTPISGFAKDKNKFRKLVDITTNILYGMFRALGINTGSETIYDKFKMPISGIKKILDNEMPTIISITQKFAEENKDVLKDYGYTEKLKERYGKEADGYITYLSKPIEGKAIRSAATKKLVEIFSDMSKFFKKELDNEMIQYQITQATFYAQYLEARNIYDNPSHNRSLYGTAKNKKTNKTEEDVKVTARFKAGTDIATKVKMTSSKGNYQFSKLEPGIWIITFEKFGFDTITLEIEIFKGKGNRRNVEIKETE